MSEKLCGVKKTKKIDAYLKSELLDMVYKKMQKGKFKDITKTEAKNMTIPQLCKLLKIKVTKQEDLKEEKEKEDVNLERVCTPRKVKEYPNAYTKAELVNMALDRRLATLSESKKLKIEGLCKLLDIEYIDVPIKNPNKRKKKEDKEETPIESDQEEEEEGEKGELKCISESKLPLKDHQKIVVNYMSDDKHRGLLVLHPVGTGKTLTAATVSQCFLQKNPKSKVIVVTPTSLQANFKKALIKDYGVENIDRYQFYTIQSFVNASKKGKINCEKKLLILDEAHNIRSKIMEKSGVNARELLKCASKSKKVLLLSATPTINKPYDILNLFAMIEGKEKPYTPLEYYRLKPTDVIKYLACKVSVYSPSVDEIKDAFPEKNEEEIFIKMSPEYHRKYIEVLDNEIGEEHRFGLFGGTLNLIPFYNGVRRAVNNLEEKNSPKVNWIIKKIMNNRDSKFLVFSHFLGAGIELLQKRLKDAGIPYVDINGSMSKKKREEAVSKYNKGKAKILLISKAGGEGLDLKETKYVIIMEPAWNESSIQQVIGRAVRMGSHSKLPKEQRIVNIYRLFMIQPKEEEHLDAILDQYMSKSPEEDILSVDVYLRNLSYKKQLKIDNFLKTLNKLSIEKINCNKKINLKDPYFKEFFENLKGKKKKDVEKELREIREEEEEEDAQEEEEPILSSDESEESEEEEEEPILSEELEEPILSEELEEEKKESPILSEESEEEEEEPILAEESEEESEEPILAEESEKEEKKESPEISKIANLLKSSLKGTKYKLGKYLGKGMNSTVFEGFDDKGNKVAIKYMIQPIYIEQVVLKKLDELYLTIGKNIWVIKYCGRSLVNVLNDPKFSKLKKDTKKVFELGLSAIYRFYKKGLYSHSDIKLDNICVKEGKNGLMFELMDYSNVSIINPKDIANDASIYLASKYRNKYKGKSFYDLYKEKVPLSQFQPPIYGNIYWSLRASFEKHNWHMTPADDIESLILSLWDYYEDYPLRSMLAKTKNQKERRNIKDEILEFRLDPDNCPIPILRKALLEVRKNYSITVPELCKKLKLDCDL